MRLKKNFQPKQNGFTLIEVMIYGLIFSLFLLFATQIFLTIKNTTANSFVMVNLQENYTRILSDLSQTIRGAQNVISPVPGSSQDFLSLNDGDLVYQIESGVLKKVVNGDSMALTDEGVSVSAISFENIGEATQTASIKIQMTLNSNYLLEAGRLVSEDFQTTISLR